MVQYIHSQRSYSPCTAQIYPLKEAHCPGSGHLCTLIKERSDINDSALLFMDETGYGLLFFCPKQKRNAKFDSVLFTWYIINIDKEV